MDVGQLDADAQLHTNEEECTHVHIETTTIILVLKHTDSIHLDIQWNLYIKDTLGPYMFIPYYIGYLFIEGMLGPHVHVYYSFASLQTSPIHNSTTLRHRTVFSF